MSYAERQDWVLYVKKNGPLNPMLRMEGAISRALLPFLKKGTQLKEIMVWPKVVDSGPAQEVVMQLLASAFQTSGNPGRKTKYKVIQ